MKRAAVRVALLVLVVVVTTSILSQSRGRTVVVDCASAQCPSRVENGLLLVAKTSVRDDIAPSSAATVIVDRVDSAYRQVIAFRSDRAPAIETVDWANQPDPVTLHYPDLYRAPLQVWVICGSRDCNGVT